VRSVASVALQVLRMIEETLLRGGTHNLIVRTRSDIAIYVLNHKRAHLRDLEERFRITVTINADAAMGGQTPFMIERGEQVHSVEQARAIAAEQPAPPAVIEPEDDAEAFAEEADEEAEVVEREARTLEHEAEEAEDEVEEVGEAADAEGRGEAREGGEGGHRRRRRRRRGRRGEGREPREGGFTHETTPEHAVAHDDGDEAQPFQAGEAAESDEGGEPGEPGEARERAPHGNDDGDRRRRRRGRRGGRRNRRGREGEERFASDAPHGEAGDEGRGAVEPEVADAVADFGGPPVTTYEHAEAITPPPEPVAPRETAHASAPEPTPAPPPEAPAAPEPPRRRSTVREPVSFVTDEGPASYVAPSAPPAEPQSPPPEPAPPVAQERPQDDATKPRRTGWWSKRALGG
jgi:ribonuclease E